MGESTSAVVGRRLAKAREEAELSQDQLALLLGRSQAAISHWESGRRSPGLDDLYEIAAVLQLEITDFLPQNRYEIGVQAALRAIADRLDQDVLRQDVEKFLKEAEGDAPPAPTIQVESASAKGAAEELIKKARVRQPPVDVEELAGACGVRVLQYPFQKDLSGLVVDLEEGTFIGVNRQHPITRQRFTIAHELGHVLLSEHDRFHIDLESKMEHSGSPLYDWRNEREANVFAASLLMPANWVEAMYRKTPSVGALADAFNVSSEAMGYRLVSLRLR